MRPSGTTNLPDNCRQKRVQPRILEYCAKSELHPRPRGWGCSICYLLFAIYLLSPSQLQNCSVRTASAGLPTKSHLPHPLLSSLPKPWRTSWRQLRINSNKRSLWAEIPAPPVISWKRHSLLGSLPPDLMFYSPDQSQPRRSHTSPPLKKPLSGSYCPLHITPSAVMESNSFVPTDPSGPMN